VSAHTASSAIDILSVGMVLMAIGVVWTRSLGQALLLFAIQSVMLATAAACAGLATDSWHVLVGAGLTLTIKAIIAPLLLWKVILRLPTSHDVQASISQRTGILLAIGIALLFARVLDPEPFHTAIGAQRVLPTAVTVMAIGMMVMVTNRQALTQVVGFLILENSMALAALTATYGMPLVIELGVFLDLLSVVFVAFIYTSRMHVIFGSVDTHSHLRTLKG
jgi:hydrogenase-4 component E